MTFRTVGRRGYDKYLNTEPGTVAYLNSLGAIAIYDGTLNGSNIANLGSAGSAIDGVPTNVTIDSNGMNFNGTTSVITIPNHASWVDLPNFTYIAIAKANAIGENNAGRIWTVGSIIFTATTSITPNLQLFIARATTAASSTLTNPFTAFPSQEFIVFKGWDGTNITGHSAKLGETVLTAGTNSNGSGAVTSHGASSLFLGNRNGTDRTWDGYIKLFAIIPTSLDLSTRTKVAKVADIIP